jgi:hypothetical protein
MMLYQDRVFVATTDVYDIADSGGFSTVEGQIPRVFVPLGTRVYDEPVIRMGVLGVFTIQKAVHHWFTTDRGIEIARDSWLDALPPLPACELEVVNFIIFETATSQYASIITRNQKKLLEVAHGEVNKDSTIEASNGYVMQLIKIIGKSVLITDSIIALGDQYSSFQLKDLMNSLPVTITGQMILHMFNALGKIDLHKWESDATDTAGINEILVVPCSPAKITGYAQFLQTAAPADKALYS